VKITHFLNHQNENMKKNVLWLYALMVASIIICSCQKENLTSYQTKNNLLTAKGKISGNDVNSLSSTGATQPVTCGTPLQVNLVDNYPDQFYMTYGNITVSNDASNVYITLTSLTQYNFAFKKIMLTLGDLAHMQAMVPYYDYPVGPPTADYVQDFTTAVNTYTFTIPRTSLQSSCFNIFVWALEVKSDNSDFHDVWVSSTTRTTGNPNSSYINYCIQACTIGGTPGGGKGGDGDDDDHNHHGKKKGHDKDDHDKGDHDRDHHDSDKD
jgi:hypothetical protein